MFSRTRNGKSRCRDSLGADNSQVHTGLHPIKEPISVKLRAFLISQLVKNSPAMQQTLGRFLGREDLLKKG